MEFKQKFACMKDCSYIGEKQIEIIERISMDIYIWLPQWWQNLLIQLSLEVLYLLSILCCRNYRFLLMFVTLIIDDHQHHKAIAIMLNLLNTKQSVFFVLYVFVISYFILFFFFLCDINFFLSLG